ncbi:MAG: hypothetical protein ACR2RE_12880 [Geminicoccaceae bacterium]
MQAIKRTNDQVDKHQKVMSALESGQGLPGGLDDEAEDMGDTFIGGDVVIHQTATDPPPEVEQPQAEPTPQPAQAPAEPAKSLAQKLAPVALAIGGLGAGAGLTTVLMPKTEPPPPVVETKAETPVLILEAFDE